MAFLARRGPALALLVVAAATLGSCALIQRLGFGPTPFAFSHAIHSEQEMDFTCLECHAGTELDDDAGMPGFDVCGGCHAYVDADKPADRRVETLFRDETFLAAHVSLLDEEVVFSHLQHVREVDTCGDCHQGIEHNDVLDSAIGVPMSECTSCHANVGAPNECADCHREIDEEWYPPSHYDNWELTHGKIVRAHAPATVHDCGLCHTEQGDCLDCHLTTPPSSHTEFFRQRGHVVFARMDRDNCAVCHEASECDTCHKDAVPRTHTGLWGSPVSSHCVGCHTPLRPESGCMTCHRTTPSHLLAPPKPAWHTPAMNCRSCHFPGSTSGGLTHLDNGDDCNSCHP